MRVFNRDPENRGVTVTECWVRACVYVLAGRSRGGQTRKEQMGEEGYSEMRRQGGLTTMDESGGERAAREGIDIDESKFKTKS